MFEIRTSNGLQFLVNTVIDNGETLLVSISIRENDITTSCMQILEINQEIIT
jgi:hypothetical protein